MGRLFIMNIQASDNLLKTVANQDRPNRNGCTVLVLGASNVSLAWSEIVSLVVQSFHGPIDLVTAQGMGRAYVTASSGFAFCRLPGILHSGLWDAFSDFRSDQIPSALITDLGNDLLYGRSVSEVVNGAIECIHRIRKWNGSTDIVLTLPPVESVLSLNGIRFGVMKRLLFPFSPLDLSQVKRATQNLFDGLQQVAADQDVQLYAAPQYSFGFDPIHVRRRYRREVFSDMLSQWGQPPCSTVQWKRFRKVVPQVRQVLKQERRHAQPVVISKQLRIFAY